MNKNIFEVYIFIVSEFSSSGLSDDLLSGIKKLYDSKLQNKSREYAATDWETVLQAQI